MTPPVLVALTLLFAGTPRDGVQLTRAAHGHVLANRGCWSADGNWLLYDVRADETVFDGRRVERVHVGTGEIQVLVDSPDAPVGVPTCAAEGDRFVFLRGPSRRGGFQPPYDPEVGLLARPGPAGSRSSKNVAAGSRHDGEPWPYAAWHRHGVLANTSHPGDTRVLDARDLNPPFTPGALRGGTHLHTFSPDGTRVASTYEDHVLATAPPGTIGENRRVVAVTVLDRRVDVPADHPRNQSGAWTVTVTRVHDRPTPGSDEIARAFSDAWVDDRRIAFLGSVTGADGREFAEVFVADLPDDLTRPGDGPGAGPLAGTPATRPNPPAGVVQRRLTFTADAIHPGTGGPRFWPVGSPDGTAVGFYRRGDDGRVRFCTVPPDGGPVRDVTDGTVEPTSAFTWRADGTRVAFAADGGVFTVHVPSGEATRLTSKFDPGPTHHACVFSPDGSRVAYMRRVDGFDQIFVVDL